MKTLSTVLLLFLLSCNSFDAHIKQQVHGKVETAREDMRTEVQKAKRNFTRQYEAVQTSQPDSLDKRILEELRFSIISTDDYLDSLKREMDKLDESDVSNLEMIQTTFLYNGAGDSIINKLKRAFTTAQNAAKTDQQKLAIRSSSDALFGETSAAKWKEQLFGQANSLGASMIIYGLQTELYNVGMKALSEQ